MPQNITARAPRAWRFRRCPACFDVFPAGQLRQLDYGGNWNGAGISRCACPGCGHRAQRYLFRVMRDARRDGGE